MTLQINFDDSWNNQLLKRISDDGPWANWELYKLAVEVEQHNIIPEFEGLQAPKYLSDLSPLPHQLEVAKK